VAGQAEVNVTTLSRLLGGSGVLLCLSAGPSMAQTPAYITAKPDAAAKAFGGDMARRIFSGEFTPARQQAVLRSQKLISGFDCPSDPQIALQQVIPFPVKAGVASWIERYVLGCKPPTMRNFLMVLEAGRPVSVELLPGMTNTDPLLQSDALKGTYAAIAGAIPKDCTRPIVTDTRPTSELGRGPWTERWTFDLCGTAAQVDMTFTPTPGQGTNWSAALVK
jgi:hypothetical protein